MGLELLYREKKRWQSAALQKGKKKNSIAACILLCTRYRYMVHCDYISAWNQVCMQIPLAPRNVDFASRHTWWTYSSTDELDVLRAPSGNIDPVVCIHSLCPLTWVGHCFVVFRDVSWKRIVLFAIVFLSNFVSDDKFIFVVKVVFSIVCFSENIFPFLCKIWFLSL